MEDRILTETEAAAYLGLKPNTLNRWRMTNSGPAFSRIGTGRGAIRYRLSELDRFITDNTRCGR